MKRRARQPCLEVFLDAETEQATWCPNDILQGYVRLSADSSMRGSFLALDRIVLKFVAGDFVDEKKFRKRPQVDANAVRTPNTPFFEIDKVLWGMHRNVSSEALRLLANRQYKFPFAIQLPHINYPKSTCTAATSIDDDEGDQQKPAKQPQSRYKVYFVLQAAMEAAFVIKSKPLHIQFSPLILTKIQGAPPEKDAVISTPDAKNVAKARVTLARQAYCPGDLITGHVTICNLTSSKLSRVKISFIQRTELIDSPRSSSSSQPPTFANIAQDIVLVKSYLLHNGEKRNPGTVPKNSVLDNYAFELRIPLYAYHSLQLPSRKISINHFVRLSFSRQQCYFGNLLGKNSCGNKLNVDVPVMIGTVQHYINAGDENLLFQMPDLESSQTAHRATHNLGFEVRPYFGDLATDIDSVAMAVGDKLRIPTLIKRPKKVNRELSNFDSSAFRNNPVMSAGRSCRDSENSTPQTISSSSWPEISFESENFEDSPMLVVTSDVRGRMLLEDTDEEDSGEDNDEVEYYRWDVNSAGAPAPHIPPRPLSFAQPMMVTCAQTYICETQHSQSLPMQFSSQWESQVPFQEFFPERSTNHFPLSCTAPPIRIPNPAATYPDSLQYSHLPQNDVSAGSYIHPPSITHFQASFHTKSPAAGACPLQTNYNYRPYRVSTGYYHATTSTGQQLANKHLPLTATYSHNSDRRQTGNVMNEKCQ